MIQAIGRSSRTMMTHTGEVICRANYFDAGNIEEILKISDQTTLQDGASIVNMMRGRKNLSATDDSTLCKYFVKTWCIKSCSIKRNFSHRVYATYEKAGKFRWKTNNNLDYYQKENNDDKNYFDFI